VATTEELRVLITAQDQASAVFRKVGGESSAVANAMKGVWVGVGASIGQTIQQAVGDAFKAATDAVIGFNASLEQSRVAWGTMLGGAQQADAMLTQLQQFAATTPFEFPDVERAARRLTAMGFAAKDIVPLLTDIGNTAAALGVGTEGVDRISLALGQMSTRTKVSAEDMLQLTEIGVPAWRILAQATGQSIAQVQDAAAKGTISAQTFINAFRQFAQSNYGGLMERQSQTFSGAVSNIKDAANIALSSAFKPLFEGLRDLTVAFANFISSEGVRGFANAINAGLRAVGAFLGLLGSSPSIMKIVAASLIGIAGALTIAFIPAMVQATIAAAQATIAFARMALALALANLPMALLAAAIAALALVVIANWDDISRATGELVNVISQLIGQLVQWLRDTALPALVAAWAAAWNALAQLLVDALNTIGKLWNEFWGQEFIPSHASAMEQLLAIASAGYAKYVEIATNAFRAVLTAWN
jgi:tape measure domain-containing protein